MTPKIWELLSIRILGSWQPERMNEGVRFLPLHVSCWASPCHLCTVCTLQHEFHSAEPHCKLCFFLILVDCSSNYLPLCLNCLIGFLPSHVARQSVSLLSVQQPMVFASHFSAWHQVSSEGSRYSVKIQSSYGANCMIWPLILYSNQFLTNDWVGVLHPA